MKPTDPTTVEPLDGKLKIVSTSPGPARNRSLGADDTALGWATMRPDRRVPLRGRDLRRRCLGKADHA